MALFLRLAKSRIETLTAICNCLWAPVVAPACCGDAPMSAHVGTFDRDGGWGYEREQVLHSGVALQRKNYANFGGVRVSAGGPPLARCGQGV
jgi:hypothetical protein